MIARGISILRRASSSLFYEKPWASRKKLPNGIVLHAQRGASKTYFEAAEYVEVEAALSDIITVADQGDARLLIVLFPSKESAYEHEYGRLFPGDYLGIEERGYTRICAMAKARDVDCIDLTAMFRHRAREGERLYFDEDPHWNESGHRLAAEIIGKHLRR